MVRDSRETGLNDVIMFAEGVKKRPRKKLTLRKKGCPRAEMTHLMKRRAFLWGPKRWGAKVLKKKEFLCERELLMMEGEVE